MHWRIFAFTWRDSRWEGLHKVNQTMLVCMGRDI